MDDENSENDERIGQLILGSFVSILLATLIVAIIIILTTAVPAQASTVTPVFGGGTGTSTAPISQVLYGGASAYQSEATGTVTCAGSASCGAGSYVLGSSLTITGSAIGSTYPFTPGTFGVTNTSATSTALNDTAGFISIASSTIELLSEINGTTTNATSTNLDVSGTLRIASLSGLALTTSGNVSAYGGTTCTSQVLTALNASAAGTCNSVTDSYFSGQLGIAHGGTNAGSFGTSNGIVAYNGTSLVNFTGYTLTSTGLTAANASTTQLTSGTNTFYVDPSGNVTSKDVATGYSGINSSVTHLTLSAATSTATWTATSTPGIDASPETSLTFAGTIKSVQCKLNTWLGVNIQIAGTSVTPSYFVGSSTEGTETLTGNNTFTAGSYLNIYFGTTTTAVAGSGVVRGSCTLNIVQTT